MKSGKLFLSLSLLYTSVLLLLGGWWLYLLTQLGERLQKLDPGHDTHSIASMVKWEGGTFLILLGLLAGTLIYLFLKDQKKTKGLQAFYAGMTHELKTPLASVLLQAEVINQMALDSDNQRITELSERLMEDSQNLEGQMDKILQLSRIEGGGNLNLEMVDPKEIFNQVKERYAKNLKCHYSSEGKISNALADEMGLELIFRNLLENTLIHSTNKEIYLSIKERGPDLVINYTDQGTFDGPKEKLTELFFKYNSKKGSGIGLYLCRLLSERMGGVFKVSHHPYLNFEIVLQKVTDAR